MILGVDVWEGSLDIDETTLRENGVKFVIPRLNSMNGGHHMDENFLTQWAEAVNFLRAPYFVYNPWCTGEQNAEWLFLHLPVDTPPRIFCDIEVRYPDYPAQKYAEEVAEFIEILKIDGFEPCIYTGAWFLPFLSYWPSNVPYWFARYPGFLYPDVTTIISWPELQDRIEYVGWYPDPIKLCPGEVKLWQCTADRYILPGCANRAMDVNLWRGTQEELEAWWGGVMPAQPEPVTTGMQFEVLADNLNVRSAPSSLASKVGLLTKGQIVTALNVAGTAAWIEIAPNKWAAVQYGSARWMRLRDRS